MKSILINKNIDEEIIKNGLKDVSLTACLGNFNGIHLGHQLLIKDAKIDAKYDLAVISFANPLGEFNIKNKDKELLLSKSQKEVILKRLGVKYNIEIVIDEDFLSLSPLDFINNYLKKLGVKQIFVGDDFYFGKDRKGDAKLLSEYFEVNRCKIYSYNKEKISTRDIISLIKEGNIKLANELLGYNFEMKGEVVEGLHNGKTIGFPTLNLSPEVNYPMPSFGVYKVITYILGIPYLGLANVGVHPTIDKLKSPTIEIHLLNYEKESYGKTIYVEFLKKIRDEIKFNSVNELQNQIKKDIQSIKDWF